MLTAVFVSLLSAANPSEPAEPAPLVAAPIGAAIGSSIGFVIYGAWLMETPADNQPELAARMLVPATLAGTGAFVGALIEGEVDRGPPAAAGAAIETFGAGIVLLPVVAYITLADYLIGAPFAYATGLPIAFAVVTAMPASGAIAGDMIVQSFRTDAE